MNILTYLVIGLSLPLAFNSCEFSAVHITLGDYFNSNKSDHVYTVGFSSKTKCNIEEIFLRIITAAQIEPFISTQVYERAYTAPNESGVKYERYFYFVYIAKQLISSSPCQFTYQLMSKENESKLFSFKSDFYCKQEYKLYTLGDHDNSKVGISALEAIFKANFDLLVMSGDFVTYYQTEDGKNGDAYFETLEPLLTKVPFVIIPGFKERFDDYKMFNARFKMPGCKLENLNCDVFFITDYNFSLVSVNLERMLYNADINKHRLLEEVGQILNFLEYNEEHDDKWLFVMTNLPFYCSSNSGTYPCNTSIFHVKPFDDLFELFQVNVVLTSSKRYYESVKNVFNYNIRSDHSRQFLIAGTGGSKQCFLTTKTEKGPVGYKLFNHKQGVLELNIYENIYKSDFLEVPSMISMDVAFAEKYAFGNDWVFLIGGMILIGVVIILLETIKGEKFGKALIRKSPKKEVEQPLVVNTAPDGQPRHD
jgi:hypothetical protein